jgi:hypothetical protein
VHLATTYKFFEFFDLRQVTLNVDTSGNEGGCRFRVYGGM